LPPALTSNTREWPAQIADRSGKPATEIDRFAAPLLYYGQAIVATFSVQRRRVGPVCEPRVLPSAQRGSGTVCTGKGGCDKAPAGETIPVADTGRACPPRR